MGTGPVLLKRGHRDIFTWIRGHMVVLSSQNGPFEKGKLRGLCNMGHFVIGMHIGRRVFSTYEMDFKMAQNCGDR